MFKIRIFLCVSITKPTPNQQYCARISVFFKNSANDFPKTYLRKLSRIQTKRRGIIEKGCLLSPQNHPKEVLAIAKLPFASLVCV